MRRARGTPRFVPGLELSERYYREVVRPLLDRHFPGLRYAAGLLGPGSEVLGFDTPRSADHEWGPRLLLFLPPGSPVAAPRIVEQLRHALPHSFLGYSTSFGPPDAEGTRVMLPRDIGPVDHKVTVTTVERFLDDRLGIATVERLEPVDWLLFTEQALLEVTAGAVFHDGIGTLTRSRETLASYPHDVWLYRLSAQWMRISQQEPFVGRTGEVDDELGSRVVAADVVRDVMRLAFLLERRYAPYSKWLGSAFARLELAPKLTPHLQKALAANTWEAREAALGSAYEIVAERQNALALTPPQPATLSPFHDRPFQIIHGERFAAALHGAIRDERVRRLPYLGGIDQFADATDLLAHARRRRTLKALYEAT